MERTRRSIGRLVATIAVTVVTGGLYLLVRHHRRQPAGAGRWRDEGGGPAGVREPRRPLPRDLVGAAAAVPADGLQA
jgi:hypothetical protein